MLNSTRPSLYAYFNAGSQLARGECKYGGHAICSDKLKTVQVLSERQADQVFCLMKGLLMCGGNSRMTSGCDPLLVQMETPGIVPDELALAIGQTGLIYAGLTSTNETEVVIQFVLAYAVIIAHIGPFEVTGEKFLVLLDVANGMDGFHSSIRVVEAVHIWHA